MPNKRADDQGEDRLDESVGKRIQELRKARSWSPTRLANEAGISSQALHGIESGASKSPSFASGVKIAAALGVSPWFLAFGEEPPKVSSQQPSDESLVEVVDDRLREALNPIQQIIWDELVRLHEAVRLTALGGAKAAEVAEKLGAPPVRPAEFEGRHGSTRRPS